MFNQTCTKNYLSPLIDRVRNRLTIALVLFILILTVSQNSHAGSEHDAAEASVVVAGQALNRYVDSGLFNLNIGFNHASSTLNPIIGMGAGYIKRPFVLTAAANVNMNNEDEKDLDFYGGIALGYTGFSRWLGPYITDVIIGAGELNENDRVTIIEPRVRFTVKQSSKIQWLDILQTFGLAWGGAYRYVTGSDSATVSDSDLQSLSLFISLDIKTL